MKIIFMKFKQKLTIINGTTKAKGWRWLFDTSEHEYSRDQDFTR